EALVDEPATSSNEVPSDPTELRESYEVTGEMPAYVPEGGSDELEAPPFQQQVEEADAIPEEEAVEAPPEEELPAQEECDEATFFMEQSLYDEASEILETVLIAYPGHSRATELMA